MAEQRKGRGYSVATSKEVCQYLHWNVSHPPDEGPFFMDGEKKKDVPFTDGLRLLIPPPVLVGRDQDLAELAQALAGIAGSEEEEEGGGGGGGGGGRCVLLTGQPGVGKTALALNAAQSLLDQYPRQFLVRGSSLQVFLADMLKLQRVWKCSFCVNKTPGETPEDFTNVYMKTLQGCPPSLVIVDDLNDKQVLESCLGESMNRKHTVLFISSRPSLWTNEIEQVQSRIKLEGLSDFHAMELFLLSVEGTHPKCANFDNVWESIVDNENEIITMLSESFGNVPLAVETLGRLVSTGEVSVEMLLDPDDWLHEGETDIVGMESSKTVISKTHVRGISGIVELFLSNLPDCPLVKMMLLTLCLLPTDPTPSWIVQGVLLRTANIDSMTGAWEIVLSSGLVKETDGGENLRMSKLAKAVLRQMWQCHPAEALILQRLRGQCFEVRLTKAEVVINRQAGL